MRYDLIFMDIIMPNLDGISATSIIRENHYPADVLPIIAMTSNIRSEDIDMYFRYGLSLTIAFPASINMLM